MNDTGGIELQPQPNPEIDVLLKDPSHPAYISPDATILDLGTGRDEVLPMSPAFYMLADYLDHGRLFLSDIPPARGETRGPEAKQLLGKYGLAPSLSTIQRFQPDLLSHIATAEFDMFETLPTDLPQFDVVFDHLTTWDWLLNYASLDQTSRQDIANRVVHQLDRLVLPSGKLILCTTMRTAEEKQKQSLLVTALQDNGFQVTRYGPCEDTYTVSPSMKSFVYKITSMARGMQGYIAENRYYIPTHQATHMLLATK